jgi:MFS family permease
MTDTTAPTRPAFSYRAFRMFWIGRIVSILSFQMLVVAIGWQLYTLTGSALDLGLVGLVQFLPMAALTLVAGQVADRYDRRLVAAISHAVKVIVAAVLVAGTLGGWQGKASILALMAVLGAARTFENPVMSALVPEVVPRPLVPRAMAGVVSANQTAQIVGPAVGGVLVGVGPAAAYGVAGALFVVAGVLLAAMRTQRTGRLREPVTLATVFSGVAFIMASPPFVCSMIVLYEPSGSWSASSSLNNASKSRAP